MKNKFTVSYDHVKTKLHTFIWREVLCKLVYASEYKPVNFHKIIQNYDTVYYLSRFLSIINTRVPCDCVGPQKQRNQNNKQQNKNKVNRTVAKY